MLTYMQNNPEILRDVCASLARRLRDSNTKVRELILSARADNRDTKEIMSSVSNMEKFNILIVDDQPNILAALKRLLGDEYNVFTAPDGKSALSIMELHDIALVLTDYRMPEMSGVELLENVKQIHPDAIRIIISGHIDQSVLMKAIKTVQVHEILSKPWREEEITFSIARWIEQYRRAKRLEEKANQYMVVERKLEEANKLIEKLTQDMRQMSIPDPVQEPWHKNLLRRRSWGRDNA
jgi:response regulator RpfG family c-di-GMP phosphodiesterase